MILQTPTEKERQTLMCLGPVVRNMLAAADDGPGWLLWTDSAKEPAVMVAMSFKYVASTLVVYADKQGTPWVWLPASEASIMRVIVDDLGAPPVSLDLGFPVRGSLEPPWSAYHGGQAANEGDSARGVLLSQLKSAAHKYAQKKKSNA